MKRYVLLGCLLCGLLAGTGTAHAQEGEQRSEAAAVQVVSPAGRAAGEAAPGLVRLRRRIAQIRGEGAAPWVVFPVVIQAAPPSTPPPLAGAAEGLTWRDLDRLEASLLRRLDQRLDDLLDGLIRAPGRSGSQVIVLPEGVDRERLQVLVDSLRISEQAEVPIPRPSPRQPAEQPPATVRLEEPATVEQVERDILETGLFQSVHVNFEFDRSVLLPAAEATLTAVGDVLQRYPELRIRVEGHTDSVGPAAYNERLSRARAEAVRTYLIDAFSIDLSRLEAEGYGESRPVASNRTPTGRTLNRRVAFRVLNPEAAERYRRTVRQPEEGQAQQDLQEALREVIREEMQRAREQP